MCVSERHSERRKRLPKRGQKSDGGAPRRGCRRWGSVHSGTRGEQRWLELSPHVGAGTRALSLEQSAEGLGHNPTPPQRCHWRQMLTGKLQRQRQPTVTGWKRHLQHPRRTRGIRGQGQSWFQTAPPGGVHTRAHTHAHTHAHFPSLPSSSCPWPDFCSLPGRQNSVPPQEPAFLPPEVRDNARLFCHCL